MRKSFLDGLLAYQDEANYVSKTEISREAQERIAKMRSRNQSRGRSLLNALALK